MRETIFERPEIICPECDYGGCAGSRGVRGAGLRGAGYAPWGGRYARYRARRGQRRGEREATARLQRGYTGYADCGCDGDMGPIAITPAEAAKQAVEAAGHKTMIPQGIEEVKKQGRPDIMVKAGVAAIFGPGTPVAYSAKVVMQLLMQE